MMRRRGLFGALAGFATVPALGATPKREVTPPKPAETIAPTAVTPEPVGLAVPEGHAALFDRDGKQLALAAFQPQPAVRSWQCNDLWYPGHRAELTIEDHAFVHETRAVLGGVSATQIADLIAGPGDRFRFDWPDLAAEPVDPPPEKPWVIADDDDAEEDDDYEDW